MIEAVSGGFHQVGSIREEINESVWSIQIDGAMTDISA